MHEEEESHNEIQDTSMSLLHKNSILHHYEFEVNSLQFLYPKQLQRIIQKKK